MPWVSGVDSVDDSGLKVERWARDEELRKNKYASRPDNEIRDAIKDAFLYDPRVFSFNVTPEVTAGWVTLRGTVDNAKAKQAAERVARHTVGVFGVRNHLKVRTGEPLTDDEIKSKVELKLTVDPYVEAYEIDADVNFGTVYLRGTVDSAFEKAQAGSVAYGVMGVTNVKNLLEVSDPYSTARL